MEMDGINKTEILQKNGMGSIFNGFICYQPSSITTNGVWQGENPLTFSLPLFILQLIIVVVTTQVIVLILKPLHQPRVICEIIGGILLGPTGIGSFDWFGENIFPLKSIMVLETMANIGILYYMFIVGVEMDVSLVTHINRETLAMIIFGLVLPLSLFVSIELVFSPLLEYPIYAPTELFYLGITVSFTAFPVLSRILVELKLFNTGLGRKAMSTALILDLCGWFLTTIWVAWVQNRDMDKETLPYVPILSSIGFVLSCIIVIRPAIMWIVKHTPEGDNFNEFHICLILTGVMICGFITDAIGTHFVFGAFVFGLVIPNGLLGTALLEKLEDFVITLLLPLFFVLIGLNTNFTAILWPDTIPQWENLYHYHIIVIFVVYATKMFGTFLVGSYYDMQMFEAVCLGMLMNTKGVIEMIVLILGLTTEILEQDIFSANIFCILAVTAIATPTTTAFYKINRHFTKHKCMTIQKAGVNSELKILMCFHNPRNVHAMINILEASHGTKKFLIHVYALHLVELTGRASSMLIIHNAIKSGSKHSTANSAQTQSEYIVKAFQNYVQNVRNVIFRPITVISPYATMYEDVCNLAKDKRITIIVVPFHKQQTVDGSMESANPALYQVNQNILANAPCSVGILIDRGLSDFTSQVSHYIVVIFIGGSDDREALTYGWRMAQHPGVDLTVIRFVSRHGVTESTSKQLDNEETLNVINDMEREAQLDNEYIGDFRLRTMGQEGIVFKENIVNNAEEIVRVIRCMETIHDLYIVGRGQGIESSLIAGLNDFSENPELGAIGDLLASSDFAKTFSVLVVQQYVGEKTHEVGSQVSPGEPVNKFGV